jgi:hypothetical protein
MSASGRLAAMSCSTIDPLRRPSLTVILRRLAAVSTRKAWEFTNQERTEQYSPVRLASVIVKESVSDRRINIDGDTFRGW